MNYYKKIISSGRTVCTPYGPCASLIGPFHSRLWENEGFCLGMDKGRTNQRQTSGAGMALSYDESHLGG